MHNLNLQGESIFTTNIAIWVADPNATPKEMSCSHEITSVSPEFYFFSKNNYGVLTL
jgi:hypothetical protein